jgi:hypothetical protein
MLCYNRQVGHIGTKKKIEEMFHFKKQVDANHGLIVKKNWKRNEEPKKAYNEVQVQPPIFWATNPYKEYNVH